MALLAIAAANNAYATDTEPRAYSNIPTGLNFLAIGYAYSQGNMSFALAVPITNGKITIHSSYLAYVRPLDLWGQSGKRDIIIPEAWLSGQADVEGKPATQHIRSCQSRWFGFTPIFITTLLGSLGNTGGGKGCRGRTAPTTAYWLATAKCFKLFGHSHRSRTR